MSRAVSIIYVCATICAIAGIVLLVRGQTGTGAGSLVTAGVLFAAGVAVSGRGGRQPS